MRKVRVLIADDRQEVRQELRTILPLAGNIEVIGEAADGLEAVRIAAALQPHAVILDLEMPRLDGYRAAAQIKSICPSCRVVALTVHGDEASRRMAAAAHIDAFIVKGALIISLISALTSEMEESDGKHIPAEDGKED